MRRLATSSGDVSECNKSARARAQSQERAIIHYQPHGDFQRNAKLSHMLETNVNSHCRYNNSLLLSA